MNEEIKPWYKQFWPWFLIALPGSVVIASMITINLAITDADGLVKDDYYKEGLAMNQDKAKKQMAESLGIKAFTAFDLESATVTVELNDAAIGNLDKLILTLIHPTRSNNDMRIELSLTEPKVYKGELSQEITPGNWWVRLLPENDTWYVQTRIKLPNAVTANLD